MVRLPAPGQLRYTTARRAESLSFGLMPEVRQQMDCVRYLPAKLEVEGKHLVLLMENFLRRKDFERPVGLGNRRRLEPVPKDLEKQETCPMRTPEEPAQVPLGMCQKRLELALGLE